MMNKIDGIVKKYSSGGGIAHSHQHNGSWHDKRDRDIGRQREESAFRR